MLIEEKSATIFGFYSIEGLYLLQFQNRISFAWINFVIKQEWMVIMDRWSSFTSTCISCKHHWVMLIFLHFSLRYVCRVYRITCLVNVLHLPMCYLHLCVRIECNDEDVYVWLSTGYISDGIFNRIIFNDNIRAVDTHTMWNYFLFVCLCLWDAIRSLSSSQSIIHVIKASNRQGSYNRSIFDNKNLCMQPKVETVSLEYFFSSLSIFINTYTYTHTYICMRRLGRHGEK